MSTRASGSNSTRRATAAPAGGAKVYTCDKARFACNVVSPDVVRSAASDRDSLPSMCDAPDEDSLVLMPAGCLLMFVIVIKKR